MLLELGVGDAYGAGFEFSSHKKILKFNNLSSYQKHELGFGPGMYTDDTQMSLAIAEVLIDQEECTEIVFAEKFVECFKRDERKGYSQNFYKFLKSISNGKEFLEKISADSERNGAAMRSAPLGIIGDVGELMNVAKMQAKLTHNTEVGIRSSQAVALAAHYFVYDRGSKHQLCEFISDYTKHQWQDNWEGEVRCHGDDTVSALLATLISSNTLSDTLIKSVSFGGDVDTVASLALGIASLNSNYEKELPEFLINDFENGKYGKKYFEEKGIELMKIPEKNKRFNGRGVP